MGRRNFGNVLQVKKRPGWYVRFSWEGERVWRWGGATAAEARKTLARIQTRLEAGDDVGVVLHEICGDKLEQQGELAGIKTFRDAVAPHMEFRRTRRRPSTLRADAYGFRLLCRSEWADLPLSKIGTDVLERWVSKRLKDGISGATVNRNLNHGSALMRWAIRHKLAKENPFRQIERPSEADRGRETYLTPEEARALVAAASPTMKPILLTALSTGLRKNEILTLAWAAVDLDRGAITITRELSKSKRTREVRMTPEVHATLKKIRDDAKEPLGTDLVFRRYNGRLNGGPITGCVLRHGMKEAKNACDAIPADKKPKVTFHTLRHTAASIMAMEGIPILDIARVLGHGSVGVCMRYAHFCPESGAAAIEKLGKRLAFSTPT